MEKVLDYINTPFGIYNVHGIYVEPTYWMAGAIVFLLFLLVFTLARLRYLYVHWNLGKSSISMLFWGFILAMIVEGFLIVFGRTMLTEVLGWENAPKPISTALEAGRSRLVDVLGVTDEVPSTYAGEKPTYQSFLNSYESLGPDDKQKIKSFVCQP